MSAAAPPLLRVAAKVHQFLTFTTAPNLQVAVAYGLGKPADYFYQMRKELARSRDRLTQGLERIGFPVLRSQGTYFLTVDLSPLGLNEDRRGVLQAHRDRLQGRGDPGVGLL